ncbi:MAG: LiaI-LiaF-like domain-containing protein [Acidobacteriota bacterium]
MNTQEPTTNEQNQSMALPEPTPAVPPPAPAQASPLRRYSTGLATWLSLVPGLGHVYLGLYQRAIVFFCAGVAAAWITDQADVGPLLIFFVWPFTMIDANRQAHAINAGLVPEPLTGTEYPKAKRRHTGLGFGVFLTVLGLIMLYNQFYPIDFSFLETWWPLLLVIAGAWLMGKHFLEQKRRSESESFTDSE